MYATCTLIYITKATISDMRYTLSIIGTTMRVYGHDYIVQQMHICFLWFVNADKVCVPNKRYAFLFRVFVDKHSRDDEMFRRICAAKYTHLREGF